jgi:Ca2+/H+ antiporter, TMEM165/GDT1 family
MHWEYLTVFVLAATPLLELLVVIPLGIGYGLDPVGVAVVTLAGNALPVLAIVVAFDRWRAWRRRSSGADGADDVAGDVADVPATSRAMRARRIWDRYGVAGLALVAPLLTGVHFAALAALALGSPRRLVAAWMSASMLVWTVGVTLASMGGFEVFRRLF